MLFSVSYEKEDNGCKSEHDENSRSNPVSDSLGIPVFNAVSESESHNTHADKSESTENVIKLASEAEFSVHILSVHNNSAGDKNAPEPEPYLSVFAEKRKCTKLNCRVISPTEGKHKSVNKRNNECNNADRFHNFAVLF